MPTVPDERPERTVPSSDPSQHPEAWRSALPWSPADPGRWAVLNLADPDPDTDHPPADGAVADVLAWALVEPGAEDPVVGIVDAVRTELLALAHLMGMGNQMGAVPEVLVALERKLAAAAKLLALTDGREPMPLEPADEEETRSPVDEGEMPVSGGDDVRSEGAR